MQVYMVEMNLVRHQKDSQYYSREYKVTAKSRANAIRLALDKCKPDLKDNYEPIAVWAWLEGEDH